MPTTPRLNGGVPPEVVCRNDVSLPVRTAWLPGSGNDFVIALNRRIVRLGELRVWQQSAALARDCRLAVPSRDHGTRQR